LLAFSFPLPAHLIQTFTPHKPALVPLTHSCDSQSARYTSKARQFRLTAPSDVIVRCRRDFQPLSLASSFHMIFLGFTFKGSAVHRSNKFFRSCLLKGTSRHLLHLLRPPSYFTFSHTTGASILVKTAHLLSLALCTLVSTLNRICPQQLSNWHKQLRSKRHICRETLGASESTRRQ